MRGPHRMADSRPLTRRDALLGGLAATAALAARPLHAEAGPSRAPRFLSARTHGQRHEAVLLDADGRDHAILPLPDRGHSFAVDGARHRAVAFGRQPGFFALVFDLRDARRLVTLPLPADRHFFGHGVFCAEGERLFTTENDFDRGRGVIGVYDARPGAGWQRLGELDSGGIGPHELVLLPDARTLCVANGGLLTHPDYGKTTLNLATMRSTLALLDARDGRLLANMSLAPELFQLSIRHLAIDRRGDAWFACQHQGPASERPPLLGRCRPGHDLELFTAPPDIQRNLRNYIGSIAVDPQRGCIATSSPVGGHIAWWNGDDAQCLGATARPDGCGVAALGDGRFLVSDGFGGLVAAAPGDLPQPLPATSQGVAWDNHLRTI